MRAVHANVCGCRDATVIAAALHSWRRCSADSRLTFSAICVSVRISHTRLADLRLCSCLPVQADVLPALCRLLSLWTKDTERWAHIRSAAAGRERTGRGKHADGVEERKKPTLTCC